MKVAHWILKNVSRVWPTTDVRDVFLVTSIGISIRHRCVAHLYFNKKISNFSTVSKAHLEEVRAKSSKMNNVQFNLRKSGEGSFFIMEGEEQIAKMEISVRGELLTVYHTEVAEKSEGKGFAKALLAAMVEYARTNKLKVRSLCSYVHFQFSQHPELYNDIWQKEDTDK